ncbi:MAG TPA: hypothetical protein VGP55_11305 [Chitinophagaceae bacterium]|nr:hypothetical protein [Chitinophagaceae bacterium]
MKKIYLLLAAGMLISTLAMPQIPVGKTVIPIYEKAGIKKTISELQLLPSSGNFKRNSLDATSIKPLRSYLSRYKNLTRPDKPSRVVSPMRQMNTNNKLQSPVQMPTSDDSSPGSTQQIRSNFLSIDFYENPIGWPPDPNGAVSTGQVIVCSNNGLKVFDKPGVTDPPLLTPTGYSRELANGLFITLEDFFSAVIPKKSGISDPHIRYDRLSKRWFVVAIEVNPTFENNLIFLAVSDVGKITSTSSFTFYSFNSSLFPYDHSAPYAPFFDYPTLGVDRNAVVIGGNQFGYDSLTNVGYVIDKNKLLHGKLIVYPFELGVYNFINGTVGGMYTPQGVANDDGTAKNSFFTGITYFQDGLVIAKLRYNEKHEPILTAEYTVPVQPFNNPRYNSSPGGLVPIDQNDTRLLEASIHTNKINGKSSLWTAHAIGADKDGGFISGSDSEYVDKARSASRWYEIKNIYGDPVLKQAGTVLDSEQPSGRRAKQYFNCSIAASGQGHAVLGGTTDAFNEYLNVFVAGRYYSDASGTMHRPEKATNTTAIYAPYFFFGNFVDRWGDFSQTVVDPYDDQTIWTFQEYADVDDSYGIRVVQVKAPPPSTPLPLGALSNKKDTTIILNGISANNSGFFDAGKDENGPGFKRLSVKSSGNVIVSSIKFISPVKLAFTLNTKNQAPGNYSLVITNPDGQVVTTEYTINSNMPSIASTNALTTDILNNKVVDKYIVTSGIYPNPASDNTKLQLNAVKDFNGKILLLNAGGKIASENSYHFGKGINEASLSLANLSNGTFVAVVYNQDNILIAVHKIVKQ